jgi:hypothetical protein
MMSRLRKNIEVLYLVTGRSRSLFERRPKRSLGGYFGGMGDRERVSDGLISFMDGP